MNEKEKERLLLRLDVGLESQMLPVGDNPPPGTHTHRWTVFVRAVHDAPLDATLISKVIFCLHEDFPNPKRIVTAPPYEVTETGYAGFIIPVYIHFVNCKKEYYLEYDMNLRYESHVKTKETKTLEFKEPKSELRARLVKAGAEVVKGKVGSSGVTQSFEDVFGKPITINNEKPRSSMVKAPSKPAPSSSHPPIKSKDIADASKPVSNGSTKNGAVSSPTKNVAIRENGTGFQVHKKPQSRDKVFNATHVKKLSTDSLSPEHHRDVKPKSSVLPKFVADNVPSTSSSATEVVSEEKTKKARSKPVAPSPLYSAGDSPTIRSPEHHRSSNGHQSSSSGKHRSQPVATTSECDEKTVQKIIVKISSAASASKRQRKRSKSSSSNRKRSKMKSDSGLDSDYSCANVSPGVEAPPSVLSLSLFSPDSVQSLEAATRDDSPRQAVHRDSPESSPPSLVRNEGSCTAPKRAAEKRHSRPDASPSPFPASSNRTPNRAASPPLGGVSIQSKTSAPLLDESRLNSLLVLQRKIMTIREQSIARKVADIILAARQTCYEYTNDNFEFDLFKLDADSISSLFKCFDFDSPTTSSSSNCNNW